MALPGLIATEQEAARAAEEAAAAEQAALIQFLQAERAAAEAAKLAAEENQ